MKILLPLALVIIPLTGFTFQEPGVSAFRELEVDYTHYENEALSLGSTDEKGIQAITPLRAAKLYTKNLNQKGIGWKSMPDMQMRFEEIRDQRFLTTSDEPNVLRRISWLYPKDGCYTRAALFNREAFRKYIPIPNKVFAFGNLRVKTPYSSKGVVGWWYHVAPLVQVGHAKYVLDPSIESKKPLPLEDWLRRMGTPEKIKVAICGSGTYSPSDACNKDTDGIEARAENAAKHYLELEEQELKHLGRSLTTDLGESPPWKL
jgi:hypothetical protein